MMQFAAVMIACAAAIGALYVLARPHWAFVLVLVLFPLKQLLQVYVPFVANRPIYVNMAVGLLVLAAVLSRYLRRENTLEGYKNRVTFLILGLYALWIVGILWSPSRDLYLSFLQVDLSYQILLLVALPLLIVDLTEFRNMLVGFMLVGTAIAGLIIINPHSTYTSGRLVLDLGMVGGGMTDTGSPLATASMGATVALIAAMIRPARATLLVTALRVLAFIVGMGIAIGSGSRGQVLAAGLVGIAFYPMSRKLANPKQFFIVMIGFLVLIAGLYGVFKLFIGHQNEERWNAFGMLRDTLLRLDMAFSLFDYYLHSPGRWVFGLGTGAYNVISTVHGSQFQRDYVHNVAAEVLCEHGLVGAGLFIAMMVLLLKYGRQLFVLYRDDPPMRSTVAILCGFCVYSLLEALKQGSMQFPAPFYWWIILGKLAHYELTVNAPAVEAAQAEEWEHDAAAEYEYSTASEGAGGHGGEYALGS